MIQQRIYSTAELPILLQSQILSFLRLRWPKGFFEANEKQAWLAQQENHPLHFVLVEKVIYDVPRRRGNSEIEMAALPRTLELQNNRTLLWGGF